MFAVPPSVGNSLDSGLGPLQTGASKRSLDPVDICNFVAANAAGASSLGLQSEDYDLMKTKAPNGATASYNFYRCRPIRDLLNFRDDFSAG